VSTASWSAEEAWIRRRKVREPLDERSRSSRRRRGLRCGRTLDVAVAGRSEGAREGVELS
jgi:hypothetical protein